MRDRLLAPRLPVTGTIRTSSRQSPSLDMDSQGSFIMRSEIAISGRTSFLRPTGSAPLSMFVSVRRDDQGGPTKASRRREGRYCRASSSSP
jgi:hypothetical protein